MGWIEELQIGDTVIEESGRAYQIDYISNVERITKTQIILDSGSKFRKEDGRLVGADMWSSRYIRPATPVKIEIIKEKKKRQNLITLHSNTNWASLSTESLVKIMNIVKKDK